MHFHFSVTVQHHTVEDAFSFFLKPSEGACSRGCVGSYASKLAALPWASPPLVSTAIALPAPDRFSKNIFLLSGCAIFSTAFQCESTCGGKTHGASRRCGIVLQNEWRTAAVRPLLSPRERYALLLPVPQLFADLHRLTLRGVTDGGISQPDVETRKLCATCSQWERKKVHQWAE